MAELSPQAQAVLDAFLTQWDVYAVDDARWALAAALCAAADQVGPEEDIDDAEYDCLHAKWAAHGKQESRDRLLAIATELENHQ